jgi:hypothetical protein
MSDDSNYIRGQRQRGRGKDYFDDPAYRPFVYQDEHGRELFRMTRQLAGTRTRPIINDDTGKPYKRSIEYWPDTVDHNRPDDAKLVPYRLPELIRAIRSGETIVIVEGEPKVEALREWGITATCNVGGADQWRTDYARWLRSADAVILPDNDEPGRRWADRVGRSLTGKAKRLRLLELPGLPDKGDIVDWKKAGRSRDEYFELMRRAPDWSPYYKAELTFHGDMPWQSPRWLVFERLPETGVALLAGQYGLYKSFQALELATAIAVDYDWLGQPICRNGGVLIIAVEDAHNISLRLAGLVQHKVEPFLQQRKRRIDPRRLSIAWTDSCPPLLGNNALAELTQIANEAAAQFKDRFGSELVLIVVDTLAAAAGWIDENDNAEAQRAMNVLRELSKATGALVLALDHHGRDIRGGPRGASAKGATADAIISALGDKSDDDGTITNTRLSIFKLRNGPQGLNFAFEPRVIELGQDEFDRRVTTVVIEWSDQPYVRSAPKPKSLQVLEQAIQQCAAQHGNGGGEIRLGEDQVREVFRTLTRQDKSGASAEAVKKSFKRALKLGQKFGSVASNGQQVWLAGKPAPEPNF